ncbi:hypothetical protein HUG17_9730 [Dermatophagoides farinae]|uniref:Uncharacterized protein n=1 Tax=Dermatophagoides farinae TaxID=6954 RepID=A0A9D4P3K0_DERFA|nr:hypothetical protein HUG17_9730 [Dermatophagoides farinae]
MAAKQQFNNHYRSINLIVILIFLATIISSLNSSPIDDQQRLLRDNIQSNDIQSRLADTMTEIEWLLNQLVNLLTDMVDGIENDHTLLQDKNFRQILIQVIKRIDYILQHFENVDPSLLTMNVQNELNRIECIRIRLANYLSQSRRFDDSKCYPSTEKPSSSSSSSNNDEIMPLLTQIVSLLVQISQQLYHIEKDIHGSQIGGMGYVDPSSTTTRMMTSSDGSLATMTTAANYQRSTIAEIDWDRLFNQTSATTTRPGTIFDFDQAINGDNNQSTMTTADWSNLISQIMNGMSTTTTMSSVETSSSTTTMGTMMTTNWEDMMNQMIREFNQQQQQMMVNVPTNNVNNNNHRPDNIDINVEECISNILAIIDTIQNQTTTTTTTTIVSII